jgi:hypothetical protein
MRFSKDASERVISTIVIVALSLGIVEGLVAAVPELAGPYAALTGIPVVAAILNIIKVVAAKHMGDRGTASLVTEDDVTDEAVVETVPETDELI